MEKIIFVNMERERIIDSNRKSLYDESMTEKYPPTSREWMTSREVHGWSEKTPEHVAGETQKKLEILKWETGIGWKWLMNRLFMHLKAGISGINVEEWITIESGDDISKLKFIFAGVIDLDNTSLDLERWDQVRYNAEKKIIEIHRITGEKEKVDVMKGSFNAPDREEDVKVANMKPEDWRLDTNEKFSDTSEKLGKWLLRFGAKATRWQSWCGAAVGNMLDKFGISWLPQTGRNGNLWDDFLDKRPHQFKKVSIDHPSQALPGGIFSYTGKGRKPNGEPNGTAMNQQYWHVEIKDAEGYYHSDYRGLRPGGSARSSATDRDTFMKETGWTGYVYYPIEKAA